MAARSASSMPMLMRGAVLAMARSVKLKCRQATPIAAREDRFSLAP
jgi:hypothetical protein